MARCSNHEPLYAFDRARAELTRGAVLGLDEAGRGPLAGPVVAAAVVLDLNDEIAGLNDSKKLSPARRDRLYDQITLRARAWAVAAASVDEIEQLNILRASLTAMARAASGVPVSWAVALVDGNQVVEDIERQRQETVIGGDALSASIAAASILAKVTRDRMMLDFERQYPGYAFEQHKGYGTALHIDRIRQLGLCDIHRRSFCERITTQTVLTFD